jgi:hypothetical protein
MFGVSPRKGSIDRCLGSPGGRDASEDLGDRSRLREVAIHVEATGIRHARVPAMKIVQFTAWILLVFAVVLFAALSWPISFSAFDLSTRELGRLQAIERPAAVARSEMIREELSRMTDHDWAGVYAPENGLEGYMSGQYIEIAPSSGLVNWGFSCMQCECMNQGDVVGVSGDRIQLSLAIDPATHVSRWAREHAYLVSSTLLLVRWCDRRYVVPDLQMRAFCNSVNARGNGSDIGFVREVWGQDGRRELPPVSDLPEVPPEYREYLLESPVEAELISVATPRNGSREHLGRLPRIVSGEASAGRSSGLLPGMRFYSGQQDDLHVGTIVSVEADRSTIEFTYDADELSSAALPRVGWALSTRMPIQR